MQLRESTSALAGIVLSIVLIIGISLIPTLQIGAQGQVQRQQSSPPPPGTTAAPSTTPAPPTPGTSRPLSPPSTTPPPPPSTTPAPPTLATTRPPLGFEVIGGAVTRTATVLIPQSSMMTMLDNLQTAMNAVEDDEDAMMALQSVVQELKSAATAAGMSVENTTDGDLK